VGCGGHEDGAEEEDDIGDLEGPFSADLFSDFREYRLVEDQVLTCCGGDALRKQKMAPKKAPAWKEAVMLLEMLLA
jgi:hypothetical protein